MTPARAVFEQDRHRVEPRVDTSADDDHRALRPERGDSHPRALLVARALDHDVDS
jgi:hypothetical protein